MQNIKPTIFFVLALTAAALTSLTSCSSQQNILEGGQQDVFIPSGKSYIIGTFTLPYRQYEVIQPGFFGKQSSYYGQPQPAVLLLPGFLGERDELPVAGTASPAEGGKPLGMFELTAMELAKAGYASLRIDYRNSGKSPGKWQNISLTEQLEDVKNALKWLKNHPHLDGKRLAVLGLSQGGTLAAQISSSSLVRSVVLWSAAPNFSWHSTMFPEGFIDSVMNSNSGNATFTTPWGEEVTMGKKYFQSIPSIEPLQSISEFGCSVLSIAGSRDTLVSPQPEAASQFIEAHKEGPESLVTLDADHVLDIFANSEKLQQAISITIDWLNENMLYLYYPKC